MSKTYRRVLLKISGDCFAQEKLFNSVVRQLIQVEKRRIRLAVVIGGGNIIRGRENHTLDPRTADITGMLATVINGIRLADLLSHQVPVEHFAAFAIGNFVTPYSVETARASLKKGKIVILSGGTGIPCFSTDTAAALRAIELKMDVILKGTRVAGIFSADPEKEPNARFYPQITYEQALKQGLKIMDATAFALCQEHRIPIVVFDITRPQAILNTIAGKKTGSVVC
ncbi:MAG: UMP kinase [candidate division WOR-3 bacterium]